MPRTHDGDRREARGLSIFAGVARSREDAAWFCFVPRGVSLRTLIAQAIIAR